MNGGTGMKFIITPVGATELRPGDLFVVILPEEWDRLITGGRYADLPVRLKLDNRLIPHKAQRQNFYRLVLSTEAT